MVIAIEFNDQCKSVCECRVVRDKERIVLKGEASSLPAFNPAEAPGNICWSKDHVTSEEVINERAI